MDRGWCLEVPRVALLVVRLIVSARDQGGSRDQEG